MTRVLIVGGTGMLGHKLWQIARERFDTFCTVRAGFEPYAAYGLLDPDRTIEHVAVEDIESVVRAIRAVRPDVVVNCVGLVKQHAQASDPLLSIAVNAAFPHHLAQICQGADARLIHISTDCVFSGQRGAYTEHDLPDPPDLYGRTKLLGEMAGAGCLTLRTSLVGRELASSHGLLEWLLAQQGKAVRGWRHALFSGLTSLVLADLICTIISHHPELVGIWHVSSQSISKLDILLLFRQTFGIDVQIAPDDSVAVNRTLDSTRFRAATNWQPPGWPEMVMALAADPTDYSQIRRT